MSAVIDVGVIVGSVAGAWLVCGALWWTAWCLGGYDPNIFDFWFVWRWRR